MNSSKCVVLETKVTGQCDLELHLSVHIEDEKGPSFIDDIRKGTLICKRFSLGILERALSDGCSACGRDTITYDRELEFVFAASKENITCLQCQKYKENCSRKSKIVSDKKSVVSDTENVLGETSDIREASLSSRNLRQPVEADCEFVKKGLQNVDCQSGMKNRLRRTKVTHSCEIQSQRNSVTDPRQLGLKGNASRVLRTRTNVRTTSSQSFQKVIPVEKSVGRRNRSSNIDNNESVSVDRDPDKGLSNSVLDTEDSSIKTTRISNQGKKCHSNNHKYEMRDSSNILAQQNTSKSSRDNVEKAGKMERTSTKSAMTSKRKQAESLDFCAFSEEEKPLSLRGPKLSPELNNSPVRRSSRSTKSAFRKRQHETLRTKSTSLASFSGQTKTSSVKYELKQKKEKKAKVVDEVTRKCRNSQKRTGSLIRKKSSRLSSQEGSSSGPVTTENSDVVPIEIINPEVVHNVEDSSKQSGSRNKMDSQGIGQTNNMSQTEKETSEYSSITDSEHIAVSSASNRKDDEVKSKVEAHREEFPCSICYKSFILKRYLIRHLRTAGTQACLCDICGVKFHSETDVNQHKLFHSGRHLFMCETCHRSFWSQSQLNKHVKIHLAPYERPHICEKCGKGFIEKSGLKDHLYTHADNKPFTCQQCGAMFAAEALLRSHKKSHSQARYRCYTCNKEYKVYHSLKEHLQGNKSHCSEDKPQPVESDYEEKGKSQNFKSGDGKMENPNDEFMSLMRHPNRSKDSIGHIHEGDTSSIAEFREKGESFRVEQTLSKNLQKRSLKLEHKCLICYRMYVTSYSLNRHYIQYGKVCFRCGECNAKFHRKEDRSQHRLMHKGVHPLQCRICFKSFKLGTACKKHELNHLPTFRQPLCDQSLTPLLGLDKLQPSPNKTDDCGPYKCDVCKKQFNSMESAENHKGTNCLMFKKMNSKSVNEGRMNKQHEPKMEAKFEAIDDARLGAKNTLRKFAYVKHHERIRLMKEQKRSKNECGVHICDKCGKKFNQAHSFRRHRAMKHGSGRHQCKLCSRNFYLPIELKHHMVKHIGSRSYQCNKCLQAFFNEFELRKHRKVHLSYEERCFECSECSKKFLEKFQLRDHMATHSGNKSYICSNCGKEISTNVKLRNHTKTHDQTVLKCYHCPKMFKQLRALHSHVESKHALNPVEYPCKVCGKSFSTGSGLHKHKEKHSSAPQFKCEVQNCCKHFFTSSELKLHVKTHNNARPYKCDTCEKEFKSHSILKTHAKIHFQSSFCKCQICDKIFRTEKFLSIHMQKHYGERNKKCNQCGSKFVTEQDLAYHKKLHLAKYKCNECGKVFNLETRLKTHLKIHEGPAQVQCPKCLVYFKNALYLHTTHLKTCDSKKSCPYCGRNFQKLRTLNAHLGVHTGLRPFMCEKCGHAYPKKDQLENHIKQHDEKRHRCSRCGKQFSRAHDLKRHEDIHAKQDLFRKKALALQNGEDMSVFEDKESSQKCSAERIGQRPIDILEQAALSISMEADVEEFPGQSLLDGETVVQYVQADQLLQLEDGSLLHESVLPPVSAEQIVVTTLDASQFQVEREDEIIMVAMMPEME